VRKVVFLSPMYFDDESCVGGGERYPLNLARGLAESSRGRYQVEYLSYGPRSFRKPLCPGVTLRVMAAAGTPRHPLNSVSWESLDAVASADVVHVMQAFTRSSEIGVLVGRFAGKPVCVTDLGGVSTNLGLQFGLLELADRVVCISEFSARMFPTSTPVVTIKGGVDGRQFTPAPDPVERDRVLYVGRLLPHKGIDKLIEALPAHLPLTVCGRPYHPDYFARLKKLAEGKRVEFVTSASDADIRGLYRQAWVNVLPSTYRDCYGQTYPAPELMGLTLLEGMACGTPVICSRVGAMPEFVRHGETGFVFDTTDELTKQLRLLAENPDLVERMGTEARRAVDTEFDLRACGARLAAVYDELIDTARSVRGVAA
jgi:glycosyltransferase involved in cell wall biosynthesis